MVTKVTSQLVSMGGDGMDRTCGDGNRSGEGGGNRDGGGGN